MWTKVWTIPFFFKFNSSDINYRTKHAPMWKVFFYVQLFNIKVKWNYQRREDKQLQKLKTMFVVLYFMPWFTNHPTLIWTNFGYMSTCGKMALTVGTMYCIFDVFAARFQSFSVMEGSSNRRLWVYWFWQAEFQLKPL